MEDGGKEEHTIHVLYLVQSVRAVQMFSTPRYHPERADSPAAASMPGHFLLRWTWIRPNPHRCSMLPRA